MTLALLLTAVGGAWASNVEAKIGTTEYATLDQAISSAQDGDIIQLQSDAALTAQNVVEKGITIDFNGYIISADPSNYGGIWWKVDMTFIDSDDTGRGGMKCYYGQYPGTNAKANLCGGRYDDPAESFKFTNASSYNIPTGYEIVNINPNGSADADGFISRVVRNYLNADKTEATMEMPASDVTVTYELVRDLSVETQVTVGDDHSAQPRYRVQKQGNVFQPVGMDQAQVMALFHVHDQIEDEDLTAVQDYTVLIYAVDIEGQPTGEAITFQNFTYAPGQYIVKAQGQGNYVGQTTESNVFTLYQGYEIVVAANEYATYYKDEALYIEDEDAQLYTITAVGKETATATEVTTAAANMPILVKNNSTETKTILLIPTTDQTPDDVTAYEGFRGTLEATTIAASTENQTNYAFNGKQFVYVKNALDIAANKAWLEIPTGMMAGARAINLVFGETTGLSEKGIVNSEKFATATWYDLNGRKLQGIPTKKGIYIFNGRKVVVK